MVYTRHKHLSLCYFYNIVHVYPNLPLVPYSPQHILCNTHSFMQFSAHTNHFQHSFFPHVNALYGTHYLLHHLSLFLSTIFTPYSLFYGHKYYISVLLLFLCYY